jgi:hypothetical protein
VKKMDRKDLSISNDDLADIFGGAETMPPVKPVSTAASDSAKASAFAKASADKSLDQPLDKKPAVDAAPLKKEESVRNVLERAPAKSKLILNRAEEVFMAQEMAAAQASKKDEHSVDDLIKRAQEIEKENTKSQDAELNFADFIDEKTVTEIVHAFNDLKSAFSKELAGKIDQRTIDNMMLRSLEKTAVNFILLKNTSWDSSGELKQDGSVDADRLVKNMALYREQIQEIDKEIEESFKALMFMRFLAVKKGLGADKYSEIKNGLIRRAVVVEGGHRKAIAKFIIKNIMENSMRKADEEK